MDTSPQLLSLTSELLCDSSVTVLLETSLTYGGEHPASPVAQKQVHDFGPHVTKEMLQIIQLPLLLRDAIAF